MKSQNHRPVHLFEKLLLYVLEHVVTNEKVYRYQEETIISSCAVHQYPRLVT